MPKGPRTDAIPPPHAKKTISPFPTLTLSRTPPSKFFLHTRKTTQNYNKVFPTFHTLDTHTLTLTPKQEPKKTTRSITHTHTVAVAVVDDVVVEMMILVWGLFPPHCPF